VFALSLPQTAVVNSAAESDAVMPSIENASDFSLGDGVYYNVQGNINFYNSKRKREEIEGRPSMFYNS
jgi:hypothetical protein